MVKKIFQGDGKLWLVYFFLLSASLLSVFSATESMAILYGSLSRYIFKHIIMMFFGVFLVVIIHKIPYNIHYIFAFPMIIISVVLLILTLFVGVSVNNASRWLVIPGVGLTFQTSDLAKYALINFLAARGFRIGNNIKNFKTLFYNMIVPTLLVVMFIMPANLSTALILGVVAFAIMFIGGARVKHLLLIAIVGIILGGAFIFTAPKFLPNTRVATWEKRIESFFSDKENITGEHYQLVQAKIAIATGGILGKGTGNSTQKSVLPQPDTDFIYAIILEEYGLWGGFFIIFFYFLILLRLFANFVKNKGKLTYRFYLQLGITLMIVSQAFVNMGVAVGIFPVTGQPLPLVSMGGSSFLMTSIAFGILLSTTIEDNKNRKKITENYESNN